MCIILFAINQHPKYKFIVAANRDEFYDRPTLQADFWEDSPDILAGKDLVHRGTWIGVSRTGRFAAVTNVRDPNQPKGRLSRGNLVKDFLAGKDSPDIYLRQIERNASEYTGFNLLVGEISSKPDIHYFSNRGNGISRLEDGIYGLSNHLLDTPWHKVKSGKSQFRNILDNISSDGLFEILSDKTIAAESDLPNTGIGIERERLISPIFIGTPIYGTRCSTLLLVGNNGEISFTERNYLGESTNFSDQTFDL